MRKILPELIYLAKRGKRGAEIDFIKSSLTGKEKRGLGFRTVAYALKRVWRKLTGKEENELKRGCVVADGKHRIENHTLIEHRAGHCTSNELYKYVLSDEAVGVFEGRVLVHPNAQKTVSHETNQNLCTTKECRMFTKPELEIYADDVKCSHGSSVGQLNDAALFYMQQRGIPLAQGRKLLQDAFIAEVLEKIPNFHVPLPTE